MKKNNVHRFGVWLLLAVMVLTAVCLDKFDVYATEVEEGYSLVGVEKYEVSNEKIIPGEEFTLTITLVNYSEVAKASNVLLDIENPGGVAPVYGTVSQIYVGDMAPQERRKVSVEYDSLTTITDDVLNFYVTTVTSTNQNYNVLYVPAGLDSPFSVISTNIPDTANVDEIIQFSVAFKVLGEENVKDVVMSVSSDGAKMGESLIGIVTPGITKTQQLYMSFSEAGEYTMDLALEYIDNVGQKRISPIETVAIRIQDSDAVLGENDENIQMIPESEDTGALLIVGMGGMLALGLFFMICLLLKKK